MSKPTGKLIRVTTASIGAVPVERKVNNKPLSADISLSAGDVGAYSKTESDNKYQPKGNYAPTGNYAVKGESYTKTESDGRYQPKGSYQPTGNYALKGDSYTKNETDNRYEIKGHDPKYKYVTVYSGSWLQDNQAISIKNDYRGCWFYCTDRDNMPSTPAFIPDDNILIAISSGSGGHARLRLENGGKTLRCVYSATSGAPVKIVVRVRE